MKRILFLIVSFMTMGSLCTASEVTAGAGDEPAYILRAPAEVQDELRELHAELQACLTGG
jgi:hypothetical protein